MLFVGLGNPEPQYANHRHNIGFQFIDRLSSLYPHESFKPKFKGLVSGINIKGTKVILFKPQNFMNLSGHAVAEITRFYKIEMADIFVFHDELDIKLGRIKYKFGGSPAGHNGIRSIDYILGNQYHRIRIGIDHPGHRDYVNKHVLSDFHKDELSVVTNILDVMCEHISLLCEQQYENFAKSVNHLG